MKYLKIMGLCLVAALALSVVASASAAEPELRAKGGGAIVKTGFTGKGTSSSYILETAGNGNIECTALKATGKVNSGREAETTVTFTGCKAFGIANCKTTNATGASEIITTVSIVPRWANVAQTEVLLLISILPVPTGFVEINCGKGAQVLKVYGSFLVGPIPFKTPKLIYNFNAKQKKGKQEPLKYFNEKGEELENSLETEGVSGLKKFKKERSGEEAAEEVKFEEEVEFV